MRKGLESVASLQGHGANGIVAAHPLFHLFVGGHLLVGAKLLIQLLIDLFPSEQSSKPPCDVP